MQSFCDAGIPVSLQSLFHDTSSFSCRFEERYREKALISYDIYGLLCCVSGLFEHSRMDVLYRIPHWQRGIR